MNKYEKKGEIIKQSITPFHCFRSDQNGVVKKKRSDQNGKMIRKLQNNNLVPFHTIKLVFIFQKK
jgi:hypothetical protein